MAGADRVQPGSSASFDGANVAATCERPLAFVTAASLSPLLGLLVLAVL